MATTRKLELNALLNPIQKTVSGVTSSVRNMPSVGSFLKANVGGEGTNYGPMLFSFAMALFIIFLVLLILHYSILPIFSFTSGDGGILPLANTTDGELSWKEGPPLADISANVIRNLPYGFTIQQDIYMDNEQILSNRKRVFLYRAMNPVIVDSTETENLIEQYPESNLFAYLSPNTNDLIVTAITQKRDGSKVYESAPTLLNVPTKQVIRLTIVFLPELLEVYLNGKLHGTRTFKYTPISSNAYFFSTPDAFRGSVRAMNFKYWDRAITAVEVSKSSPPLADKALFSPDEMATAQCRS